MPGVFLGGHGLAIEGPVGGNAWVGASWIGGTGGSGRAGGVALAERNTPLYANLAAAEIGRGHQPGEMQSRFCVRKGPNQSFPRTRESRGQRRPGGAAWRRHSRARGNPGANVDLVVPRGVVILAHAGIQAFPAFRWIPTFVGMTEQPTLQSSWAINVWKMPPLPPGAGRSTGFGLSPLSQPFADRRIAESIAAGVADARFAYRR